MVSVQFQVSFFTGHIEIFSVDYNTDVALVVEASIISGFMLATNEDRAHAGHTAERDTSSIEQVVCFPFVLDC